jgi:transcription elongation factor Elf1
MADKRTYRDRAEANKAAVAKRRKKLRTLAIEYKGGKCIFCGYDKLQDALESHHLDKSKKDFGISQSGLTRSWERVKNEVEKCILVCANCHREIHAGILQPPLETVE